VTIPVLDISHWKYPVDFDAVRAAGFEFVIAKATEGETWIDPNYAEFVEEMGEHGIIDGSYHYFRGTFDPLIQASHYATIAGNAAIPLIVDVERINNVDANRVPLLAQGVFTSRLLAFLGRLEQHTGRRAWIYTNKYSWTTLTTSPAWSTTYKLWVASYAASPIVPPPWVTYILWQYTAAYPIAGKYYDANKFPGTKDELLALCQNAGLTLEQRVKRLEDAALAHGWVL